MDFTREPIIETVITPREGYRLVVRSSKGAGSEEHFVDALEVVSFGSGIFFRSLERPKPFIVPVSDYEVLEVREPRMVLKTPSEQSVKVKDPRQKQEREPKQQQQPQQAQGTETPAQEGGEPRQERGDRRRDRRRGLRRRRGGRDEQKQEGQEALPVEATAAGETESQVPSSTPMLASILPPPTKLIRDDLKRLREDYKGAFYINEDKEDDLRDDDDITFREPPYAISEEDIRMSEGGDAEVPQDASFRPSVVQEEANAGPQPDSQ